MTRWKTLAFVIAAGAIGPLAWAQSNTGDQPATGQQPMASPQNDTAPPPSAMGNQPQGSPSDGKGGAISLSDAPPAVQATLKKEAQDNQIKDLKQTKDLQGNTVYQAQIAKGSQHVDIQVAPDGTLVKKGAPQGDKGETPAPN